MEELSAKRYDTALESCDGMLEASPKDAEAALCRALVHALRGDSEEEDDDYCTLWLKRCDRWRVDGEDCMGVPWGELAPLALALPDLKSSQPGRRRFWISTSPPTAATPRWRRRYWRGAAAGRGRHRSAQMPVVEITESTAAQTAVSRRGPRRVS